MVIPPSPGMIPRIKPISVPATRNPTEGQDKIPIKEPQNESILFQLKLIPSNRVLAFILSLRATLSRISVSAQDVTIARTFSSTRQQSSCAH